MTISWKEQAASQREAFLRDLQQFLAIPSVEDMDTAGPGRPFGEGVAQAMEFVLAKAKADGFTVRNLDGYAGVIEYGEGEDEVGVLAHVDVVPPGDGWTTPPFQPDIRDGRIYARGAIDDKGPLLAAYYALKMLKDSGAPLAKKVRFIVGTDEESGWLCMKHFAEVDRLPDVGFSPDAEFPIVHAEKGQINVVLRSTPRDSASPSPDTAEPFDLLSLAAGERGNMVPDRAKAVLAVRSGDYPSPLAAELVRRFAEFRAQHALPGTADVVRDQITLTLQGKAAHGMVPHEGINAGLYLCAFLSGEPLAADAKAFVQVVAEFLFGDVHGERLGIACEDEPSGKLTVNAGILKYSSSEGGVIHLNIRYPVHGDVERMVETLQSWASSHGMAVESVRTSAPHYVPADHPAVKTLQKVYEEQTGEPATLLSTGGATYARSLKHGVAFGAVFPGKTMTAHEVDEYAEIEDLLLAMSIYAQAMYELAQI